MPGAHHWGVRGYMSGAKLFGRGGYIRGEAIGKRGVKSWAKLLGRGGLRQGLIYWEEGITSGARLLSTSLGER